MLDIIDPTTYKYLYWGASAVLALIANWIDLRYKKIPNKLTVPFFAAGVAFHILFAETALIGLQFAGLGFLLGFGIMFILWIIGGGGAGDVKFLGAVGAWLGWGNTLAVFILTGFFVAIYTIVRGSAQIAARKSNHRSKIDRKKVKGKYRFAVTYARFATIAIAVCMLYNLWIKELIADK